MVATAEPQPARRGGRPSREQAALLGDRILDVAADLFLTEGYGATSIEAVAQRAAISKRTFYHRFPDKAALFDAVLRRIIQGIRPSPDVPVFEGGDLREVLLRLARLAVHASVAPITLALTRLMLTEANASLSLLLSSHAKAAEAKPSGKSRRCWSASPGPADLRSTARNSPPSNSFLS